jgi:hypothetical protein
MKDSRTAAAESSFEPTTSGKIPAVMPKTIANDTNHILGVWKSIVIVVWRNETTVSAIVELGNCLQDHSNLLGKPIGLFMVAERRAPLPTADSRKASADVLQVARLAFSALTFEGTGFRAAAVRGVVTGISMLAKQAFPHKAFATVEDAAAWASQHAVHDGPADAVERGLLHAIRFLRSSG